MYNHLRTLLINQDGTNRPGFDFPGEELVPAEYKTTGLPASLQSIRRILFGGDPDRAMLNYRVKQLLSLIQCTELQEFVTQLDPRLTYDIADENTLAMDATFQPTVEANSVGELQFIGSPESPDMSGRSRYVFRVITIGDIARVWRAVPNNDVQDYPLTVVDGLSNAIPLEGSGYSAVLNTAANTTFNIQIFLRPTWDLGQLVPLLERVGEPALDALLGITKVEPYQTFRNLWYDHDELPYRLGAIVLALGYRTEELRHV